MHKQSIDILRKEPSETEWLEFKQDYQDSQLIGEYLSALSNSACLHNKKHGYLIYGIDNKTHDVVGTTLNPRVAKAKGNQALEPWLAASLSPRVDFRIFEIDFGDKQVVVFRVDATTNTPVRFRRIAYIRIGEHKHELSKFPEKERKIWNNTPVTPFEGGIALDNQTVDEVLAKISYSSFFDLLKIPVPNDRNGFLERLHQENVIVPNGSNYDITNLGGILFAKQLDMFPSLVHKTVRVTIYDGNDRMNAQKEQKGTIGYAVGFEGLVNWIWDQLPANEIIQDALRVDRKMYPKVAIREFVANAIIHQDFAVSGAAPMIEVFSNRMEITNPGAPLVSTDRFIDSQARSRNEKLATLMHRMNICERRGSGIDRAVDAIEVFQLPAPDFQADSDFTRVILYAHKELKEMDRKDKIRACYQHCCLKYAAKEDYMTNASLRKRFGVPDQNYSTVSRIIRDALDAGAIKVRDPESKSNKRCYVPKYA